MLTLLGLFTPSIRVTVSSARRLRAASRETKLVHKVRGSGPGRT